MALAWSDVREDTMVLFVLNVLFWCDVISLAEGVISRVAGRDESCCVKVVDTAT